MAAELDEKQLEKINKMLKDQEDLLRLRGTGLDSYQKIIGELSKKTDLYAKSVLRVQKLGKGSKKRLDVEDALLKKYNENNNALKKMIGYQEKITSASFFKSEIASGKTVIQIRNSINRSGLDAIKIAEKNLEINKNLTEEEKKQERERLKNARKQIRKDTVKAVLSHKGLTGLHEEYTQKKVAGAFGKSYSGAEVATGKTPQLGVAGGLGKIFSGKTQGLGGTFDMFKGIKKQITDLKDVSSLAGKSANPLSVTIMGLGNAFKALNVAMKGNIFLLILTALVEMGKAMLRLDKILKENNKRFAELAGSIITIGKGDLGNKMVEYGKAIHDLTINMKYGIDSLQAGEVFAGFKAGGMTLGGVTQRIGDYKKVLEDTIVMSKNLGVSFQDMGNMISDNMLAMRKSFGEVSDSLNRMGYDAAITGIDTNKFYQSIESASSSLRMYGNYLDYASGMLRDYVKTGSMGFQDAAEQVKGVMGIISGTSMAGKMKMIALMGGIEASGKLYAKVADENKKKMAELKTKMAGTTDETERNKLMEEYINLQDEANKALKISTGGFQQQAFNVKMLAGHVKEILYNTLKTTKLDIFNPDHLAAVQTFLENIGMDAASAERETKQMTETMMNFNSSFETLGDTISKTFGPAEISRVQEFKSLYDKNLITREEYWGKIEEILKAKKTSPEVMSEIKKRFNQSPELMARWIIDGLEAAKTNAAADIIQSAVDVKSGKKTDDRTVKMNAAEQAKQTTSIEGLKDIMKDGMAYSLASSNVARDTLGGVYSLVQNTTGIQKLLESIMGFLTFRWGTPEKTDQQKWEESPEYKKYVELTAALESLDKTVQNQAARIKMRTEQKNIESGVGKNVDLEGAKFLAAQKAQENILTKKQLEGDISGAKGIIRDTSTSAETLKTTKELLARKEKELADLTSGVLSRGLEASKPVVKEKTTVAAVDDLGNPIMADDLLVTKSGILPMGLTAGDRVTKKESQGEGLRAPAGSLLDNNATNWTDVMDKASKVNSDNKYTVGAVTMNFNKVVGDSKMFEQGGPAEQLFYRMWQQMQRDKK